MLLLKDSLIYYSNKVELCRSKIVSLEKIYKLEYKCTMIYLLIVHKLQVIAYRPIEKLESANSNMLIKSSNYITDGIKLVDFTLVCLIIGKPFILVIIILIEVLKVLYCNKKHSDKCCRYLIRLCTEKCVILYAGTTNCKTNSQNVDNNILLFLAYGIY